MTRADAFAASRPRETPLGAACANVVELGVHAALLVAPLLVDAQALQPFEPVKVATLRTLAALVGLAWLVLWIDRRRARAGVASSARSSVAPAALAALAIVVAYGLSSLCSLSPSLSVWGSERFLQGSYSLASYAVLFGSLLATIRGVASVERYVTTIVLGSVPVCLYAIAQRYGVDPVGLSSDPRRVASTLGSATFLAAYCTLVLPITLARCVGLVTGPRSPSALRRSALHASIVALQLLALVLSQSRGAFVGASGALFVFVLVALLLWRARRAAASSDARRSLASWSWAAWLGTGLAASLALLALSLSNVVPREWPFVGRLASVARADTGTGALREALWSAALRLVGPHEPLGIASEPIAPPDPLHVVRPLVGFGPETTPSAFACVYPPEVARWEGRSVPVDRVHNGLVDDVLATGWIGALAALSLWLVTLYLAIGALFGRARRPWTAYVALVLGCGIAGGAGAWWIAPNAAFVPLGFELGLVAGVVAHLVARGLDREREEHATAPWMLIGVLAALVGHALQMQFAFSIAVTCVHAWVYLAIAAALAREREARALPVVEVAAGRIAEPTLVALTTGLALAILAVGLRSSPLPLTSSAGVVACAVLVVTWAIGFEFAGAAARGSGETGVSASGTARGRWSFVALSIGIPVSVVAVCAFPKMSLAPFDSTGVFESAARMHARQSSSFPIASCAFVVFAGVLGSGQRVRTVLAGVGSAWRIALPVAAALAWLVWSKNIDFVRASSLAKHAQAAPRSEAIRIFEHALALDGGSRDSALLLADACRTLAQSSTAHAADAASLWQKGETALLRAQLLDPYDPMSSASLGKYQRAWAMAGDASRYPLAAANLERAAALAPRDVTYAHLAAELALQRGELDAAEHRIRAAIEIDARYPPAWTLLGDVRISLDDVDGALAAHATAIELDDRGYSGLSVFADEELDRRVRFYAAKQRVDDLLASILRAASPNGSAYLDLDSAPVQSILGHVCLLAGRAQAAVPYLERAVELGERSRAVLEDLAAAHASLESNPADASRR